jgi:hypothetical protein
MPVSEDSQVVLKLLTPPLGATANVNVGSSILSTSSSSAPSLHTLVSANPTSPTKKQRRRARSAVHESLVVPPPKRRRYHGPDELDVEDMSTVDVEALAKNANGMIDWVCEVPAEGKIYLALGWELSIPHEIFVVGI